MFEPTSTNTLHVDLHDVDYSRGNESRRPVAMATIGKTLFAHFRQVLHASAQYDQAITVFHRLQKRLEVSNLCSLSWDQTVTFSDLAHGQPGLSVFSSLVEHVEGEVQV